MSIKLKFALMIVLSLGILAGAVGFYTKRDVEQAVFVAEQRSARNVLHLVELDIRGRYKNMLMERLASIRDLKERLGRLSQVVVSGIDAAAGERENKQARRLALDWISDISSGKDEYLFVFDEAGTALAYPDPDIVGTDLSGFQDVKGRPVTQTMVSEVKRRGTSTATYYWKPLDGDGEVKHFGMFTAVPQWDWVLGAAVPIDDIERAEQEKLQAIVRTLEESLEKVRIAETGFVFVFRKDGTLLVPPPEEASNVLEWSNSLTGNSVLDDLRLAAEEDGRSVRFAGSNGANSDVREANVTYYKTLGWYIASVTNVDELRAPARALVGRLSAVIGVVLAVTLVMALLAAVGVAKPLERLTRYAKKIPEQDFLSEDEKASEVQDLAISSRDEVGRLARAFVFMEESLRQRVRELMETTAAKERIESELNVAHDIQMGLLPKVFPDYPKCDEIKLSVFLEPAKEVGGDLYDFFFIDEDHLCLTVGDVSDKGVPAALFMAITMTLIRAAADRGASPHEIMADVNEDLSRDNPRSMFVTLFLGILNVRTGHLRYANGGHNLPVKLSQGRAEWVEGLSGPIVGAMENLPYAPLELQLEPGEQLFVYTDGVTEAMNAEKELYSDERLLEKLNGADALEPDDVVHAVRDDVALHVEGEPASDDITMLCVYYIGPKEDA